MRSCGCGKSGAAAVSTALSSSFPSRASRERGSGSVYVLGLIAIVVLLGMTGVSLGAGLVARHRAAAAADLSALSAAAHVLERGGAACETAAHVASAQGARLTSCRLAGAIASVTVQVSLPGPLSRLGPATGQARAGPTAS